MSNVLIADDSPTVRAVLRQQVEGQGHTVIEAVDGDEAIVKCKEVRPDVVLLDVEMPRLDGWGALTGMKADSATAEIPVIFLTAHSDLQDVVRGLSLGAHDYLRKPFDPSELIARLSAALRIKELQDELRRRNAELDSLTRTDALTMMFNRRHLVEQIGAVSSRSKRENQPFGALMMDVDHFKQVNDTEGHEAGDEVLKEVAKRIRATVRNEDIPGRWGGEEFLVLIYPAETSTTRTLGERLRTAMEKTEFQLLEGRTRAVTISVGFALGPGADSHEVLKRADDALYEAKRAGRNQVVEG